MAGSPAGWRQEWHYWIEGTANMPHFPKSPFKQTIKTFKYKWHLKKDGKEKLVLDHSTWVQPPVPTRPQTLWKQPRTVRWLLSGASVHFLQNTWAARSYWSLHNTCLTLSAHLNLLYAGRIYEVRGKHSWSLTTYQRLSRWGHVRQWSSQKTWQLGSSTRREHRSWGKCCSAADISFLWRENT